MLSQLARTISAGELLNIRRDSVIKVYSLIFEEEGFQSAIHVDHQMHQQKCPWAGRKDAKSETDGLSLARWIHL